MNAENEANPQNVTQTFSMRGKEEQHVVMRIWYEGDLERHEFLHHFDGLRPRGTHYVGLYGHAWPDKDEAYTAARQANEFDETLNWFTLPWLDVPGLVNATEGNT